MAYEPVVDQSKGPVGKPTGHYAIEAGQLLGGRSKRYGNLVVSSVSVVDQWMDGMEKILEVKSTAVWHFHSVTTHSVTEK